MSTGTDLFHLNADALERIRPGYCRQNFCDLIAANPMGG
jgi:hypothetical protein